MDSLRTNEHPPLLTLHPVRRENWHGVTQITVTPQQAVFVASPAYYLAMCCYEDIWHPLAILLNDEVIGLCMWGIDPADNSCWLGGVLIDQRYQGQGHGKGALRAALELLRGAHGQHAFALSYHPNNRVAKHLYTSLGFRETGEQVDDEVVARLPDVRLT